MSLARRKQRDSKITGDTEFAGFGEGRASMNLDKIIPFTIDTPNGPRRADIPIGAMKCCPCGNSTYREAFRVVFFKPADVLGAEVCRLRSAVYLCDKCDREVEPADPSIAGMAKKCNGIAVSNAE